ncbi:hypothetical protein [Thalassobacter stenotrophicus]|uniref:Uncharacterized protein n=2 Tax=Thalassobacter stenotrophicus TaxID=266809 RepID=A0A0P1FK85_9RHOB|nr:hypothetical protein [Thalassobacter stenotrophicus]PVZ49569.1 hypothetical protein DD557_12985 [Thalassobacter stenotrophicus]CUH60620.1 hypothetical protein THS5294_01915 [Thalassobacter stenotrophicus]SHJ37195.1 hypothetical protein SAMN02744035_03536 [Thalassobacter stenotrophicus DSM 16310]
MTLQFYDQNLSPEKLATYQGYSLQVFTSGRIKLSFHHSHTDRVEYYADRPKRHREAYARQVTRSATGMPDHYALTEQVLSTCPYSLTYRVHLKRDNNATADNAHVIVDTETDLCHVILSGLHHQWVLPSAVCQALLERSGPRKGAAACFNEYLKAYDHDWQDATFGLTDYREGYRTPGKARANYVTDPSSEDDALMF